ncbi:aldose epimerase [Burkholderia multivorans]|uniref:aldose 1-epimerase n=1 Tax=Burkholderia multivorans TaxID=87883 RepID=UPI000756399E|nr:aldose 1-epimerase [Burkholderia multivorans]KVQ80626.1 aldose epimerase [Burkholderia multivorans]
MTATSSRASSSTSQSRRARLAAAAQPVSAGPQTAVFARGVGAAHAAAITLSNAALRVDVLPHLGGGLARFDWRRDDGALVPVFRRCAQPETATDPNELACYPLLPYSNRIGGARFECDGRSIAVPRNRLDEPLPIHGDGWLACWQVDDATDTSLRLSLDRRNGAPYAFRAVQSFELDDATLTIALTIENAGRTRLPFGLGVHPFIVRDDATELAAAAGGLWLSGADFLPVRHVSVPPAWQFGVAYPLPATLVNHAFTGWGGHATVSWPRRGITLTVAADADAYVLYTPPGADFFCFEPVDHPINAVNLPGGAAAHGMTLLAPGERLTRRFAFSVARSDARTGAVAREGGRRRG